MDDIIKKKFGERLKYLRKMNCLTQEKLAECIGINTRQMARIEAGESFVTSDTMSKICASLKIQPKMLFDFEINDSVCTNKNLDSVIKKICKISDDNSKLSFIDIAIDSLYTKASLNKLKLLIKGIELVT